MPSGVSHSATTAAMFRLLPVPGPPVRIETPCPAASVTAPACTLSSSEMTFFTARAPASECAVLFIRRRCPAMSSSAWANTFRATHGSPSRCGYR